MELLNSYLPQIRIPLGGDKVYKDECVYSFDSPESPDGLFICMNTFLGFGRKYVEIHFRKTGYAVYLHIKRFKKEIVRSKVDVSEEKKITRMAIGVEGGFDLETKKKYEEEDVNSIIILPSFTIIPLPNTELPDLVQSSVSGLLAADSAARLEETAALAGTWDGDKRKISHEAEVLVQLDNGVKIPPKGWQCQHCDKVDNLWLNLTDGSILCGRKFFDGSGGNNHALEHYKQTGHSLAVKLGTITMSGADVYSYLEDEMVVDPYLTKHLAHFGINVAQLEKTDKSMIELEIDINQRIGEWATIQEAGSVLVPLYGPGYTGLANLGNSCYLNSVMQVMFSIPDFKTKYVDQAEAIFNSYNGNPTEDLSVQLAKLGSGLLSGEYSLNPGAEGDSDLQEEQPGLRLNMFKSLIGRNHQEFSTKRQQDAQEFFLHLINVLERHNRGTFNPADCFKYQEQHRIFCVKSGKVKYVDTTQYILRLPIPIENAVNLSEVAAYEAKKNELKAAGLHVDPQEIVRARIPLSKCFEAFAAAKTVSDFYSSELKTKSTALKTTRLASFPDFLMIQLEKFTFENGWIPKKLDVSIEILDEIDLSFIRGSGLQPGEIPLPEETPEAGIKNLVSNQIDEMVVSSLEEMGFPREACKRAVFNTGNLGLEIASNWIMEHIGDPDFCDPFIPPSNLGQSSFVPDPVAIESLADMGFTRDQVIKALKATDNNLERAGDWIFSHIDELDTEAMDTTERPTTQYRDGEGKYRLVAFISHMGTSTMVGHYVCHILKEGRWVIFNDNKVAISENPPKDFGYLYVYQRV